MEEGEYPLKTARREIREELGLDADLGQLLVVDWMPPQPDERPALVNFVFDGGPLSPRQVCDLRLQDSELRDWRLCSPQDVDSLLAPHPARCVHAAARARRSGHTAYLHHGWPPSVP